MAFNFFKSIDMTGVPVSIKWKGKSSHGTKFGGLVSIIGIVLVGTFILASFLTYSSMEEFSYSSHAAYVDFHNPLNCTEEGNACQFLSAN